jgi:hypothetical protein
LAAAGSEDDESLGSDAKEPAPKMTGARNESSVLFSLDALVKQEQKPSAKKAAAKHDDAAAILMGTDSGPSSLANVGTGSFGSAFAAPDFTAPVVAVPEPRAADSVALSSAAPEKKKGAGLWIALGAIVLLGGGAAVALDVPAKLASMRPPAPSAAPADKAEPTIAPPTPEAAPTTPAAETSGATAASAVPATGSGGAAPTRNGALPVTANGATAAPAAATSAPPTPPVRPSDADKPADKPAEANNAPPFDKAAAVAALTAAAGSAQSCKTADGPTGGGKVSITFMPSGRATNTQVSGDLAGTAVGGCVARLFRSAKIPPFSGDPVTVSKSFTVQ